MAKFYKKDGMISNFKVNDSWEEFEDELVHTAIGERLKSEVESEEFKKQLEDYNNSLIIEKYKLELEELTKDLAQVQAGLVISNIEEKKERFRYLLNEVRVLMGKEPRAIEE